MSAKRSKRRIATVAEACDVLDAIAPIALAQSWDNVGLLAGDHDAPVRRMLCCIDLTPAVVDEAEAAKIDFVMAYHPPIFKPVSRLTLPGDGAETAVFRCIRSGIAVYSAHTALDAAYGGTNDAIAGHCGIHNTEPLEFVDDPQTDECKVVVFVPPDEVERVANAMFDAGAGHIGDYSRCSYRLAGHGTFLGGEATNPAVGTRGKMERIDEIRLEAIVSRSDVPAVEAAILQSHSYEEPAFDVYRLYACPLRGIGCRGSLPAAITLARLARKLKKACTAPTVQIVGSPDQLVTRVVIVVGAAGSLPFRGPLSEDDVIITGEIRHHDALTIRRRGCSAIALGHWASERPVLIPLAARIGAALPGVEVRVSHRDADPFAPV
ncbi:MAG: Nif3-like dinuclear metal center hexameric protein [Planctomycetes bacterium]|nr:Nif3-like dinuclear metal center hexameric protein [Planctomycetota bacterium]